ncbi:MAG: hypothetical protein U5L45_13665 [Saprospiraceae bacterium]|nr:hypothetical protein [Saprospiraceae bacterium]
MSLAKKMANMSEKMAVKITIYNQKRTKVTGVKVFAPIPNGAAYVTHNAPNAYDPNTGIWYIGTIAATTDSVNMTLTIEIKTEGVVYCFSEILAMNEPDMDSTPNNSLKSEDDSDNAAINVPITMCSNELNMMVGVQQVNAKYQWFKDGLPITGATKQNFFIQTPGSYYCQVITDSTKTISAPISLGTISAPNLITSPRTILKGEAVYIEHFVFDQNNLTRELGKVAFYKSLTDANNNQNPMLNLLVAPTQTTTFYAKKNTKECKDIKPLVITVDPKGIDKID